MPVRASALRALGAATGLALLSGCPAEESARPVGATPIAPVAVAPQPPAPGPPPKPAPQAAVAAKPAEPAPKYSADAAPVRFRLDSNHRAPLDRLTRLPEMAVGLNRTVFPQAHHASREDSLQGRAPSLVELPILLFAQHGGALTARFLNVADRWEGGTGWLTVLVDASINRFERPAIARAVHQSQNAPTRTHLDVDTLSVEATQSFRVRSLAGAKAWTLTVTAAPGPDEVVVPAIALAFDVTPGAKRVELNGKPLNRGEAILKPGTYRLSGAAELWLTVPSVAGLKIAPLDVELAAAR